MKKQTKGFTLIELLAVIVILVIIALIAVPVIMNIINSANKSAFKDTAYGIINAGELYFAEQQLDVNGMSEDETIPLPDTTNTLGLKGAVPEGSITISKEGKTALAVYNGRYCITKGFGDKDITLTEEYEECKNPGVPIVASDIATTTTEVIEIPSCITDGSECSKGTAVALQVNDTETYNFYVIDDTDGKLTLIMDRNLGDNVAWISEADYTTANTDSTSCPYTACNDEGPITAVATLKERTSGWTNILKKEYTYNDDEERNRYTAFTETMRARLLTEEEATDIRTANNGTMPSWMYVNLKNTGSNTDSAGDNKYGYWISETTPGNTNNARSIYHNNGGISNAVVFYFGYGLRPVITISK